MDLAIVGCGLVATNKYIPAIARIGKRANLKALCDVDETLVSRTAAGVGGVRAYTEIEVMLREETPEVVILCTPPRTHASLAIKALESGSNVLLEKPMAVTVEECDAILDAARSAGRKIGVMHNQHYSLAVSKAMQAYENGAIGKFQGMQILLLTPIEFMTSDEHHWAHKLDGGMLGETGPHAVYLSLPWIGRTQEVQLVARKLLPEYPWSIAEDIRFNLVGERGTSTVTLLFGIEDYGLDVQIFGRTGILKLDIEARSTAIFKRKSLRPRTVAGSVLSETAHRLLDVADATGKYLAKRNIDAHRRGFERFLAYVKSGSDFPTSGEDGREVVRVMRMLIESLERLAPALR